MSTNQLSLDYPIALQRIIEGICRGRLDDDLKDAAPHHFAMAERYLAAAPVDPSPWRVKPDTGWTPKTLPEYNKKLMIWAFGKMHWTAINETWRASEIDDMDAWRYVDPPMDAPADTVDAGGKDGASFEAHEYQGHQDVEDGGAIVRD